MSIVKMEKTYRGKIINKIMGMPPKFQIATGRKVFATLEEAEAHLDKTTVTPEEKAEAKKLAAKRKTEEAEAKIKKKAIDAFNRKCKVPFKIRLNGGILRTLDFIGVYKRGKTNKYTEHYLFKSPEKEVLVYTDERAKMLDAFSIATKVVGSKADYKYKNINFYYQTNSTASLHKLLSTYSLGNVDYELENVDY